VEFVEMQLGFLPYCVMEKWIRAIIAPSVQPFPLLMLELREGSDIETVRAKSRELNESFPGILDDPSVEFYSLMHHRQFGAAAALLADRLDKVVGKAGISELGSLRLAQWLAGESSFDGDFIKFIRAGCPEKEPSDIGQYLALAACPDRLGVVSAERLAQPQWLLHRFQWLILACLTDAESPAAREEFARLCEENPLLASYSRKDAEFRFLRFILERHRDLGNIDDQTFKRRIHVIESIESAHADFGPEPDAIPLPEPITSTGDPRFKEIVARWKGNLAWVRVDKTMGPVVEKLLEHTAED